MADLPLAVADAAASKTLLGCATSVVALFYDLCAQDLPEFFEDNLQPWMEGFVVLLKYQNGAPAPNPEPNPEPNPNPNPDPNPNPNPSRTAESCQP